MLLIVDEATVVIKQEKTDNESSVVPEKKTKLMSCFCPHGYTTATAGHYHCRYCGFSSRYFGSLQRHEKAHARKSDPQQQQLSQYYSCRHCKYVTHCASYLKKHEKRAHFKSQPVSKSQSVTAQVDAGTQQETTADTVRITASYHWLGLPIADAVQRVQSGNIVVL